MSNTINDWLDVGERALKYKAERPRREAEILLGSAINKDRLYLITHGEEEAEAPDFHQMLIRRNENEPIEYITSKVSFFSQEFHISTGALIPRPETEILIEKLLEKLDTDTQESIVEVGIGSGVISIVLAQHLEKASFLATDISPDALTIAKMNISIKQMTKRIEIFQTDLLEDVDKKIDILVSNPPYIEDGIVLEANLAFEPQNALYGGNIGDEILKRLIDESFTREVRILACEMGYDQKDKIETYLKDFDFKSLEFYKDYAGFDRGFILTLV
ncbi:MAG TPA: peptide chain release factor N(5)-glutamine methyltransferase [Sulfurimonas sp.]|nr:peptide chain release factor N(5)-glutamine methyltransferase [Sulfurimonas sp.]